MTTPEKSVKNRLPRWVADMLLDCPGMYRNATFYRYVYKPMVPSYGFFRLMLDSLPTPSKRKEVVEKHVVPQFEKLMAEGTTTDWDRRALKVITRLVREYTSVAAIHLDDAWADPLLENQERNAMVKAVSPYKLVAKADNSTMWNYLSAKVESLRKRAPHLKPLEEEKAYDDPAYDFESWFINPRRNKLYEMLRNGFDDDFQPTESSCALFTTIIIQSLYCLVHGKPSPFRNAELSKYARKSTFAELELEPSLDQASPEWQLMHTYIRSGGLKDLTMNLGLTVLSSNLAKLVQGRVCATHRQWTNLLLYRLIGQVTLAKPAPEVMVALSEINRVSLHKQMLFMYDLSTLLGRRMCYMPNLDKLHAFMECSSPVFAETIEDYRLDYMGVYASNMERLPGSQKVWDAHTQGMMEFAGLDHCGTVMEAVNTIAQRWEGTRHLVEQSTSNKLSAPIPLPTGVEAVLHVNDELKVDDRFEERVRKELGTFDEDDDEQDELNLPDDDLDEDEDFDNAAEDLDQLDQINKLLKGGKPNTAEGVDTQEGDAAPEQENPKGRNAAPPLENVKPEWDWQD